MTYNKSISLGLIMLIMATCAVSILFNETYENNSFNQLTVSAYNG